MGKVSAGVYLQVVRERRGISRADAAKRLRVSTQTIANIENGDKEPAASKMIAFVDLLGASLEDVKRLMLARDDEVEAYRLADLRIAQYAEQQRQVLPELIGQEKADLIARRLADDPDFLRAIRRIAAQLD